MYILYLAQIISLWNLVSQECNLDPKLKRRRLQLQDRPIDVPLTPEIMRCDNIDVGWQG